MPRSFLVAEGVDDKWLVVKKARTGLATYFTVYIFLGMPIAMKIIGC
jgi:hypothetical protein